MHHTLEGIGISVNTGHIICEQASLGDFSGNQWTTCFQEVAEVLLGATAQEVGELFHDDKQFQEVFYKAAFKTYTFRLRAKMENYNVSTNGSGFSCLYRRQSSMQITKCDT